jgi:long-chain acyl-CoA synthetase
VNAVFRQTLGETLADVVEQQSRRTALITAAGGRELSYAELGERIENVAAYLAAHAVAQGDVVTLVANNSLDSAVFMVAAMCAGRIVNPISPATTPSQLGALLAHSRSRLILAEDGWSPPANVSVPCRALPHGLVTGLPRAPQPQISGRSGVLLVYTSGTLGAPKGVLLSHRNLLGNVATALEHLPFGESHRTLTLLPLFHTFALVSDLLTMLLSGGACVVSDSFDIQKLGQVESALAEHAINSFSAAPLMFDLMLKLDVKMRASDLRFCVAGAAPLSAALVAAFNDRYGVPIIPCFGMTETTCFATISPALAVRPGSCGKAVGCEIRVVDAGGADVVDGATGELVIRGDSVMAGGYFRDEREAYVDGEGVWLRSGDLGYRDADGYLFIVGRAKNMIIRGGEKVYLEELDTALARMSGVLDVASVGVTHGNFEKIVTFVVVEAGQQLECAAIMSYARELVGEAKLPDVVTFCERIPRTPSNKVRMAELKARAQELLS